MINSNLKRINKIKRFSRLVSAQVKVAFLRENLPWIEKVIELSRRLPDLTPRTLGQFLLYAFNGYVEILYTEKDGPISMLMHYPRFDAETQLKLLHKLGYSKKESKSVIFQRDVVEIGLAYTEKTFRSRGYYGMLFRDVMEKNGLSVRRRKVKKNSILKYKGEPLVCLNTRTMPIMVSAAKEGMIPISFEEYPLSLMTLSFIMDGFDFIRHIPSDNRIKWMSSEDVYSVRHYLAVRFQLKSKTTEENRRFNPVWFFSVKDRIPFVENFSKMESKDKFNTYISLRPYEVLKELENHLSMIIKRSKKYAGIKNKSSLEDFLLKVLREMYKDDDEATNEFSTHMLSLIKDPGNAIPKNLLKFPQNNLLRQRKLEEIVKFLNMQPSS